MNTTLEFAARSILIGAGATLVMDAWGAALRRLGIRTLNFALLGRWAGHLPRGRWSHASIADADPVRHELLLGWCTHYAIGVSFAALLLATCGLGWARFPTLLPALCIGVVTVLGPLVVLQPALGAGIAFSKTPRPVFNSLKSLLTHTIFGLGLFLAAHATVGLIPASH
jgi:hypothetical protein